MGPAGLTAVFGMGTGVTPPVWSPEKCPAGGQAGPGTDSEVGSHTKRHTIRMSGALLHDIYCQRPLNRTDCLPTVGWLARPVPLRQQGRQRPDRGGQAAWLLGPVG